MGLVSDLRHECSCKRKKTDHKKLRLQAPANCSSLTVSLIMGLLLLMGILQIAAAARTTEAHTAPRTTEAHTAPGTSTTTTLEEAQTRSSEEAQTRRSSEAEAQAGGTRRAEAQTGPVMQLRHRMAGMEGSRARQEGKGMTIEHYHRLLDHDRIRLDNIMQQQEQQQLSARGRQDFEVVDFVLSGNWNTDALYYMEVQLGTPAQTFYVQMDTGSDLLWIDCSPCSGCPRSTTLQIPISTYNQSASSTSQSIGCNDAFCTTASNQLVGGTLPCISECPFSTLYGDGSMASGYFVSDLLTYTEIGNSTKNSTVRGSTRVSFGCGNTRTGTLRLSQDAVDGLMGFGQSSISVVSQLAANGTTPNIFAHCLQGDSNASSTLVIGEITEPGIVYTSMVPNSLHYSAVLLNIAIQGTNISSSPVLTNATGSELQVIFDSGTTLAYLVEPFYTEFMKALNSSISTPLQAVPDGTGSTIACYVVSGSSTPKFPNLTLFFEGGTMNLGSDSYLQQLSYGVNTGYCPMWQPSTGAAAADSLLGDIVLQNQIIVYNNEVHKLGWKNFDCSKTISASLTPNGAPVTQPPTAQSPSVSSSPATTNPNRAETLRVNQSLLLTLLCILGYISIMQ